MLIIIFGLSFWMRLGWLLVDFFDRDVPADLHRFVGVNVFHAKVIKFGVETFFDEHIFYLQGICPTFKPQIAIGAVPTVLIRVIIGLVKKVQVFFGVVQGITSFLLPLYPTCRSISLSLAN